MMNGYIRKTYLMLLVAFMSANLVYAQADTAESKSESTAAQDGSSKQYYATEGGNQTDPSLVVNNFNFYRSISPDGKGDVLELGVDIYNKEEEHRKLKMFVMGFYEKDRSDSILRQYVQYPSWRKVDLDKKIKDISFFKSVPELDQKKLSETTGKENPGFLQIVDYVAKNPDTGFEFPLQGYAGASSIDRETKEYTYTSKSMKTSVFTRMFSRYDMVSGQARFFNHIGVIIFDPARKKVVFRQFFYFEKPLPLY